ncbi:Dopamine receptor [Scophthalmus maximus]|uniref:Cystatin-B n=1 Tax=Scophthalmus maximus TaxID=52904 RepID=A0A2U9CX87_SCOMX|nr:Dopamine receptor [Scophthalmus maximus]
MQCFTSSAILAAMSDTKDGDEETQQICNQVKTMVEYNTKKTYEEFRAVQYKVQFVAGKNLFIKVHVGGDDYLHLNVFQVHLSDEKRLLHVLTDMGKEDPFTFF